MRDIVDNIPNLTGDQLQTPKTPADHAAGSNIKFNHIRSSFGIALHMHQPTIPGGDGDLKTAKLISNLQSMMNHPDAGDNHNAPVFLECYRRLADIIPDLVAKGKNPRVMLDYSGNLLWGLRQMEGGRVIENLKRITTDKKYQKNVEWLGTMWSHAVVSSTPVGDIRLHIMAWRNHFAAIFGEEALRRVKGFSPPEMHLPIHPDVCYEYVKALKENGYEWLMVQEHTIENADGSGIGRPHFPHRLVAKNSKGETAEITVLIKTQGSDTKLVAQMQPYYEAKSLNRQDYAGTTIPPFVLQIGDGENGGVMMNEFPPGYKLAFEEIDTMGTVGLNGSEYLDFLKANGVDEKAFTPVQPISQHRIWEEIQDFHPTAADEAIDRVKQKDQSFNLDKASWTNDRNWVKGYEDVMDPVNKLSAAFHKEFDNKNTDTSSQRYREALLYLLLSQTSCFRYWGEGLWTDYAKELCRRGLERLNKDWRPSPAVLKTDPKKPSKPSSGGIMKNISSTELLKNDDVLKEIHQHLWIQSEKAGYDIGLDWAAEDWMTHYAQEWLDYHMPGIKFSGITAAMAEKSATKSAEKPKPVNKPKTTTTAKKKRRAKSYI